MRGWSIVSGGAEGLEWQIGVWDRISQLYLDQIDERFAPVVEHCVALAKLQQGDSVLDLGTGTGAAAVRAARLVGPDGSVLGVDVSPEMLRLAAARVGALGNVALSDGRGEQIPAEAGAFDALIACLSFMYVIDRDEAARECARVLRPDGRLVAAVWAGPEEADIVRFQATAGSFAPTPPVPGVGPGVLGDPTAFLEQLRRAGIDAEVQTKTFTFAVDNFELAWEVLAGVTTAQLAPERRQAAKDAVQELMWEDPTAARTFRNTTQFIVGRREG